MNGDRSRSSGSRLPEEGKGGLLYVVATPIGNLADITLRALEVLKRVDLIAAEDTRHTRKLLNHYGIEAALLSYHEHNERERSGELIARLKRGETVALVSDAGTPLLSDPGYRLVRRAREEGIPVTPVPGPCAAIAALSASGLPPDRFAFEGFLPRGGEARRRRLAQLLPETRTVILYESGHRILTLLRELRELFPPDRELVVAKELTKRHERFLFGRLDRVVAEAERDRDFPRGEFTVLLAGGSSEPPLGPEVREALCRLVARLSLREAVEIAAVLSRLPRKRLYKEALKIKHA